MISSKKNCNNARHERTGIAHWTKSTAIVEAISAIAEGKPTKEIIYDYKESKIKPRIMSSREINHGEILLNADDQIGVLKIGK